MATQQCEPKVFVSMISEGSNKDPKSAKIYSHVQNLTMMYQSHGVSARDITMWSPIIAHPCGKNTWRNVADGMKGRGSNLAHKEIWDSYIRQRRGCDINLQDRIIIHEYDAFLGTPDTISYALDLARNMTTDFMFLGYCFEKPHNHPYVSGYAPYCLHAYAISVRGAEKLRELVDACGIFADAQIAELANSKKITWTYDKREYDHRFVNEYFNANGIFISGPFLYGGSFVQAKFDEFLDPFPEGTVAHNKNRPKQLFLLRNHTWHKLNSMDEFYNLNLTTKDVKTLSDWQFKQYAEHHH